MTGFLSAALTFPTVVFGAALVVVVCFWLLVLAGAAGRDSFDTDLDSEALGFGGVPVSVSVSLFIVVAWFTGLTGSVLVLRSGATGTLRAVFHLAVLAGALLIAWKVVRMLVRRIRRFFPAAPPPAPQDSASRVRAARTQSAGAGSRPDEAAGGEFFRAPPYDAAPAPHPLPHRAA